MAPIHDFFSPEQLKLFGAMIALAEAVDSGEGSRTGNTLTLLREGFMASDEDAVTLIERVRAEKDAVCPGCKDCMHPCGRTAEYDFALLDTADPETVSIKTRLLRLMRKIAICNDSPEADAFLIAGLRAVGEDYDARDLRSFLAKAEAL